MAFSEYVEIVTLLSTDCCANPFSQDLPFYSLTHLVDFFQRNGVQPNYYNRIRLC